MQCLCAMQSSALLSLAQGPLPSPLSVLESPSPIGCSFPSDPDVRWFLDCASSRGNNKHQFLSSV